MIAPENMPTCPYCGYSPSDEVNDGGPTVATDLPETWEEALDFFEVVGEDEGCVLCPKCWEEVEVESMKKAAEAAGGNK